jgi:hypothetical protein
MKELQAWREMGLGSLLLRLAALGALAGLISWSLAWAGLALFQMGRPTRYALPLSLTSGVLVGLLHALILRAFWSRGR